MLSLYIMKASVSHDWESGGLKEKKNDKKIIPTVNLSSNGFLGINLYMITDSLSFLGCRN